MFSIARRLAPKVSSPPSNAQFASRFPPVSEASQTSRLAVRRYALPSKPLRNGKILKKVSSVLFVKKPGDEKVSSALEDIVRYMREIYPQIRLFGEATAEPPSRLPSWTPQGEDESSIDLIITLGGDGTILHASSLFRIGPVPPVLSFSMGTLGFLLPFNIGSFKKALEDVINGNATVMERMRIACTFRDKNGKTSELPHSQGWQVMNEVALHRGRSPHLNIIDAYVNGQHLTEAVSDGLILSTPTGSTAYSLSCGGPIVHPSVHALLLTPICPRSLSFRPLVLPGSSHITLRINPRSRAPAEVSMDGQETRILLPGESISVEASSYPVPCINRSAPVNDASDGVKDDWLRDINTLLQFNVSFKNKNPLDM